MAGINTGDKLTRLNGKERLGQNRESEYLGAEDIDPGTEPILTIEGIWNGSVTLQRGKENKDVISFVENTVPGIKNVRPLIINATNRQTLRKMYKSVDADTLQGKKIQLYIDPRVRDPETGGLRDGIRIRNAIPKVEVIKCEVCGKVIQPSNGMTAQQIAAYSDRKVGKKACLACGKQLSEEKAKTAQTAPESPAEGTVNEYDG